MEKKAMCFVCRLTFNTATQNGVFYGSEVSRLRKQECSETISNLLLGSSSHPLNIYFQSAAYCYRCTKIILDVNFSWKQLTALENRIGHNLKVLRVLFRKNFEGILNKVDMDVPDIDHENLQEWESFTYDQVIQICMKVMHVEEENSVLHPDQMVTVDTNDFLKTYFEEINEEDDYLNLHSFEGQVKENEVVGNLVGSSDRIQIYAKEDDTDSSFEVSSDSSDSSSYCSSNSGGKRKRKYRKKAPFQIGQQNNVTTATGLPNSTVLPQTPNGPVAYNQVGTSNPNNAPPIQKPVGGTPVQILSINQVVSSEFLKKFPIPIDSIKLADTKITVTSAPPNQAKPVQPVISNVKPVFIYNDVKPPLPTIAEKPPETTVSPVNIKHLPNTTVIPFINFKPKVTPPAANSQDVTPMIGQPAKTEMTMPNTNLVANAPKPEVKMPNTNFVSNAPKAEVKVPNTNAAATVNKHQNFQNSRKQQHHHANAQRYRQNNSRVPRGHNRPGPSSSKNPRGHVKTNMARNYKLGRPPGASKRKAKKGHASDSSSKSVLSCSSFSSDSLSSDLDSSSDDNSLYPSTSRAKLQKRHKKSGNHSSGSSIVVISD